MKENEEFFKQFKGMNADVTDLLKKSRELTDFSNNILPKEKFYAEIDGKKLEVSIAMNGMAIVLMFTENKSCEDTFTEMKENKKGVLKRIFNLG